MSRFFVIAFTVAFAMLAGGCHTAKALLPPNLRPPSENAGDALKLAQMRLRQASPCCSSFADFSFRSRLPWQPEKFTLGSGSMVANLNGTQSYFLAFRLPADVKTPYKIAMKSALNGRWLHASYLFAPTVVLLDEGFQPIRSEDIGLCEHVGWSDETTGAFGSVDIKSKSARYLLVYSSAEQQTGKTYWEQSPASLSTTSAATLKMNSAGSFSIPHGPDGDLWIGIQNVTYEKAIKNAICSKAANGDGLLNTLRTVLPLPWSSKRSDASGRSPP
jgi:maltose operon protein